jgi:FkbM family methyltransferase
MSIKVRMVHLRDKLYGLSTINSKLEGLEQKAQAMQLILTDLQNNFKRPILPPTIQIDQKTILTKIFSGIKMYLDPRDLSVAPHIALDGIWEQQVTRAWLAVLNKNDTVLDIGANFGYFGLLAGQFANREKSKIVLFEANKNLIPYIDKSVSINWLSQQIKVENLAVSDQNGEVQLNVLKDFIGSSSLQSVEELDSYLHDRVHFELAEKQTIRSTTIDSYCKTNNISELNLIKMDIEGHEEKAYKGMRKVLSNSKNVTLFLEFTKLSYENPKKFYDTMLKDFGNVYTISNEGQIIKPKDRSYEFLVGRVDDYVMLIFSKNQELNKECNIVLQTG